ncbi:hypothetical protein Pcinc_017976 [Petrolisthes cinctipes]|uniref:Uncharacterized protein n=1 Tax=Petrolisthes cinctipes TaxID=88211 RepID=A0AAE1KMY9_PETCI|nr:hypothetical protein Pcinc_017976 [Petrolisthes cinctipes]
MEDIGVSKKVPIKCLVDNKSLVDALRSLGNNNNNINYYINYYYNINYYYYNINYYYYNINYYYYYYYNCV